MSTGTGIEWTDATWNPVTGCTRVSEGCESNRDRLTAGTPLAPSSGAPRNYATEFHAESDDE